MNPVHNNCKFIVTAQKKKQTNCKIVDVLLVFPGICSKIHAEMEVEPLQREMFPLAVPVGKFSGGS